MVVPRVISELLKSDTRQQQQHQHQQPEPQQRHVHRLAGQLHWYEHGSWLPRAVEVSGGCLLVRGGGAHDQRLPLRHLSLRPASQPRAFALTAQGDCVVAMFKAGSQLQYDRWVKALAVELLRQTPLEDIRFLDILAITATTGREEAACRGRSRARTSCLPDDREVAELLARCQQADNYVPVKEKRRLFESLCRHNRRLTHSSENLCSPTSLPSVPTTLRAQSLHDLNRGTVAVKDMCRYFEERGQQTAGALSSPVRSSLEAASRSSSRGKLERWQRQLVVLRSQVCDSEDKIWRLQDKMAALDQQRPGCRGRARDLKNHAVLEKKLGEEEARLVHLQEAASRALRKVEKNSAKLS